MSNLIAVLVDLGQYDEGAKVGETSLAHLEKWFGSDHPYVARTLHSLGTVYQGQGRIDDALRLYQRAQAIWQKNPGVGLLDEATVEASLAGIYTHQGYYSRAEALLKKSVATRESVLGLENTELSSVLSNLGYLYGSQGRLSEARKVLERGLTIAENTIGANHPRTIPLVANLAWVYFNEGRHNKDFYPKAEALFRRVLALQEQRVGPDGIELSNALASLSDACAVQKKYKEARQLEQRALAIRRVVLGPQHPDTVRTEKQYAFLLRKSKD
jgi:tetratricopeptide (TPR) repeat protein